MDLFERYRLEFPGLSHRTLYRANQTHIADVDCSYLRLSRSNPSRVDNNKEVQHLCLEKIRHIVMRAHLLGLIILKLKKRSFLTTSHSGSTSFHSGDLGFVDILRG